MINSRKLNVKAIVTFHASVEELADIELADGSEGARKDVSVKKKNIRVLELGVHKKDTLRVKKEMTIASNKPNIHGILWKDIEIRGMDLRAEEDKMSVKGELFRIRAVCGRG